MIITGDRICYNSEKTYFVSACLNSYEVMTYVMKARMP